MAKLNYYDAYKLRKILKNDFNLLIFMRDSTATKFQLLALEGSQWQRINFFRQSIVRFNTSRHDEPPAYNASIA